MMKMPTLSLMSPGRMTDELRSGLFVLCALLMLVSPWARADTPEQAVLKYFAALQDKGLASVADHMHPEELQRFRDMVLPIYEGEAASGKDELRKATFGDKASLAQVQAATPAEMMRAFMMLVGGRAASVGVKFEKVEVLGAIAEGEVRHVVSRSRVAAGVMSVTKMEVISLRQHQGEWRIMLNGQFEGMAQAIRARQGINRP